MFHELFLDLIINLYCLYELDSINISYIYYVDIYLLGFILLASLLFTVYVLMYWCYIFNTSYILNAYM